MTKTSPLSPTAPPRCVLIKAAGMTAFGQRSRVFLRSESGAITVDWVVLTALVVAMVAAIMSSFSGSLVATIGTFFAGLIP